MAVYNIIYTSPQNETYLWNGNGFDKQKTTNEKLFFSGKSYTDDELPEALYKCREMARITFPDDDDIRIKNVEVPVNSKSGEGGHTPHILS